MLVHSPHNYKKWYQCLFDSFFFLSSSISFFRRISYHRNSVDNRSRGSPDEKKSILKRSAQGGASGGSGSGATAANTSTTSDQETENLISESGISVSESGSEPLTPVMVQRWTKDKTVSRTSSSTIVQPVGGEQSSGKAAGLPSGSVGSQYVTRPRTSGTNQQPTSAPIAGLMDDWPFVDSSPTEEASNTDTANSSIIT